MNNIHFHWAEWIPGTLSKQKGVGGENRAKFDFSNRPGYRDALLKHKTFLGENKIQFFVLINEKDYESFPVNKCSCFNPSKAFSSISIEDKIRLLNCYNIEEKKLSSSEVTWIFLLSDSHHNNRVWPM